MSSEKKKSHTKSNVRKEKPTDKEFPSKTETHEQKKSVVKGKITKSHKAIR